MSSVRGEAITKTNLQKVQILNVYISQLKNDKMKIQRFKILKEFDGFGLNKTFYILRNTYLSNLSIELSKMLDPSAMQIAVEGELARTRVSSNPFTKNPVYIANDDAEGTDSIYSDILNENIKFIIDKIFHKNPVSTGIRGDKNGYRILNTTFKIVTDEDAMTDDTNEIERINVNVYIDVVRLTGKGLGDRIFDFTKNICFQGKKQGDKTIDIISRSTILNNQGRPYRTRFPPSFNRYQGRVGGRMKGKTTRRRNTTRRRKTTRKTTRRRK